MTDKNILEMFKEGYSIEYIAKQYYIFLNSTVKENFYIGDKFIIPKKNIKKQESYDYVMSVILKAVQKSKKNQKGEKLCN